MLKDQTVYTDIHDFSSHTNTQPTKKHLILLQKYLYHAQKSSTHTATYCAVKKSALSISFFEALIFCTFFYYYNQLISVYVDNPS